MSSESKQDESKQESGATKETADPKRENPAEQFERARAKAEEGAAPDRPLQEPPSFADEALDRRLDLGEGGIFSDERAVPPAPTPTPAPSPLHGTYAGELVRRIRAALEEFEQHVANDARAAAGEAHDLIADAVNELRGHFHRE